MTVDPEHYAPPGWILRRVLWDRVTRDDAQPRVLNTAFSPADQDTDGISVFAEAAGATAEVVALAARDPDDWHVVRLPIALLQSVGFSLIPDPNSDGPPGHAYIPELSRAKYLAAKKSLLAGPLDVLAREASNHLVRKSPRWLQC